MHSVVPQKEKVLDYSVPSQWYREFPNIEDVPKYEDEKIFVTTAYFVDPKLICKDGGSQKGLGDRLLFQNGASINDALTAPLKQTDADSDVSFHFLITYINQLKIIKLLSTHLNTKKVLLCGSTLIFFDL